MSISRAGKPPVCLVSSPDLMDVRGQGVARRALEIAAAGGHSLLLIGPPGMGKSMLAHRLPGILPALTNQEALELAAVMSANGSELAADKSHRRPFRAPSPAVTVTQMIGGRVPHRPGEVSFAHHGVLFLDELPQFSRRVLEALREPLESGTVTVSHAARQSRFPACFQLIAAMNPCPCGYLGERDRQCRCSFTRIRKYRAKVSGSLLDRIDMHVEVLRLDAHELAEPAPAGEDSALVANRVAAARAKQLERAAVLNARLSDHALKNCCVLEAASAALLERAVSKLALSARAFHCVHKVAQTIADLDRCEAIAPRHVGEAIQMRRFEL